MNFYEKSLERNSPVAKYSKRLVIYKTSTVYLIIIVLIVLLVRGGGNNTASGTNKIGDVGSVGGDITINNSSSEELYKRHKDLPEVLKESEEEFIRLEDNLVNGRKDILAILNNINYRLIVIQKSELELSEMAKAYDSIGRVSYWFGVCGEGYAKLDGHRIESHRLREVFNRNSYPDLTNTIIASSEHEHVGVKSPDDNCSIKIINLTPCVYIGKI